MSVSYIVNGKTYTSYPLMDEIVYNCKLILNGIVVKNEYTAHLYETEETLYNQEILYKCKLGTMTFETMPYTVEMLLAFGYDESVVNQYISDINLIPEEDRDELLTFCVQYYIDNFVEKNKYYRSLMGLPEYGTNKYNIYITESDLPSDFDIDSVDFTLPIHEQPSIVISALKSNGRLNQLIEANRSFNYSYLRFLDDLSLDVYTCRKANKWDILYLPDAHAQVLSRFQEIYNINKQIYLRRTYQTAYAYRSDYYDHMLIFILLAQTFTDMITDAPEWYIRKDIFDIRTVQFFLESYGIPFYEEIPIKYQIKIVKNLNKLIKYKSTEQNFEDILDIFKLRETHIYRYYLYKKRRVDSAGHYIVDPDLDKMYELLFVEVLLGDSYDNYIKNLNYRTSYDEITLLDEYWDGVDDHEYIKQQVLEKEFTIEPTKYLTINAEIDYNAYQRQLRYLMGLIVDSRIDTEDVTIGVPSIYEGASFKLSDLFIFISLLNNLEQDMSQYIRKPEERKEAAIYYLPDYDPDLLIDEREVVPSWWNWDFGDEDDPSMYNENLPRENYEGKLIDDYNFGDETLPTVNATVFHHYNFGDEGIDFWWIKERYPEFFVNYENRVFGFNPELDFDAFKGVVERGFTNSSHKQYTLADFGCDTYIPVTEDINTIERLLDIYENNMKCYEYLNNLICHGCRDKFQELMARYIFMELFTKEFDYGLGNTREYLDEVLRDRNYILWNFYKGLYNSTDKETRNKDIETILNEITLSLEYYMDRDSLDYFFSFISSSGFVATSRYIYLMLNTFKSYKAHFLEPTIRYKFKEPDVMAGNYIEMNDTIRNTEVSFSKFDKEYIHDTAAKYILKYIEDFIRENYLEIMDIFTGFDPDPDDSYVYDGGGPETTEYDKVIDGTEVTMLLPYNMADGSYPYGRNGLTRYQIDGKDQFLASLESQTALELDGGDIANEEDFMHSDTFYFNNSFKKDYNGGSPATDYIVNNNVFKRLYDYQNNQEMLVSARTGLEYTEDLETGKATLKETWREWLSITEYEAIKGDPDLLLQLMDNNTYWQNYEKFMNDLNHGRVKVFTDELEHKHNDGINLSVADIYAEDNKNAPWDWDYGDEETDTDNEDIAECNYEDELITDYDFMDIDDTTAVEVLHHDYNFGDNDLSRILWIENIYNYDTSRIITYDL